jgi:hypothetical protein
MDDGFLSKFHGISVQFSWPWNKKT